MPICLSISILRKNIPKPFKTFEYAKLYLYFKNKFRLLINKSPIILYALW